MQYVNFSDILKVVMFMKFTKTAKSILIIVGTILLIFFLIPLLFMGILNTGNGIGITFSFLMILYGIFFRQVNEKIKKLNQSRAGKIILRILSVIIAVILIFIVWATAKMIWAASNAPDKETTVVVLGCQVKPYGPSLMLAERLEATYEYLKENPDTKCILSGGQGSDEPMSEARCMYDWLVKKGIDKERLYIEDKSTSTRENLLFSKQIIENEGLNPAMTIITNEFHQYRASEIAKSLGIESYSVSGNTLITLLPTYYVRELGGTLFEIFVPIY